MKAEARTPQLLLLAVVIVFGCIRASPPPPATVVLPSDANALDSMYRTHDYFALRERLSNTETNLASTGFYLAAVQQAFNDPLRSNSTIVRALQAMGVSDSLRFELRRMQLSNDLRLYEYDRADSVAAVLLAAPPIRRLGYACGHPQYRSTLASTARRAAASGHDHGIVDPARR